VLPSYSCRGSLQSLYLKLLYSSAQLSLLTVSMDSAKSAMWLTKKVRLGLLLEQIWRFLLEWWHPSQQSVVGETDIMNDGRLWIAMYDSTTAANVLCCKFSKMLLSWVSYGPCSRIGSFVRSRGQVSGTALTNA